MASVESTTVPTVEIRGAVASDAADLAAVYRNAYRENRELGFPAKAEHATERDVAEWISEHRVYVATVDGDVVGSVRLEETGADRVKLSRLAVHDRWKGEGIGSRLVEFAEDAMCECGYAFIWLTTPGEHPYLPDFYRRLGYEETGVYPLEYRSYDEIIVEKRL